MKLEVQWVKVNRLNPKSSLVNWNIVVNSLISQVRETKTARVSEDDRGKKQRISMERHNGSFSQSSVQNLTSSLLHQMLVVDVDGRYMGVHIIFSSV